MVTNINFSVDSKHTATLLTHLAIKLNSGMMSVFMSESIYPLLAERADERFESEGDAASGKWAPLKPATVEIRKDRGFGGEHPINFRTGQMERFVTDPSKGNAHPTGIGATMVFPETPTGHLYDKLRTAQMGLPAPYTVPRPVVAVDWTDTSMITAVISGYLAVR